MAELEWVSISVYATYRTGRALRFLGYLWSQRTEVGEDLCARRPFEATGKRVLVEHRQGSLAKIVDESFKGRDIDKL